MNKKARVIAAINGQEVDSIPSSFSLHFPEQEAKGDTAVKAHLEFFKKTDTDIIKIMNENLVPSFGIIKSPYEYNSKIPLLSKKDKFISNQIEMSKKIIEGADKEAFTMGTLHGICASAIHPLEAMGTGYNYYEARQMLVDFFRWDEAKMLAAISRITESMCELAEEYIKEVGLDSVYYASLGAESKWFTDEEFEKWIKPFDLQIMKTIKDTGGYCFLHICKDGLDMKRYDNDYLDLTDVINWGIYEAPFSIEDGKTLFSGKTIMGGLMNRSGVLVDGNEEQIRKEVGKIVDEFGRKGFILGADCTLATEQDLNLLKIAVDEARTL